MTAIDDLTSAFNEVKAAVADGVAKIQELAAALSAAHADDETATIEQIAGDLHATAEQLRIAVAPTGDTAQRIG